MRLVVFEVLTAVTMSLGCDGRVFWHKLDSIFKVEAQSRKPARRTPKAGCCFAFPYSAYSSTLKMEVLPCLETSVIPNRPRSEIRQNVALFDIA